MKKNLLLLVLAMLISGLGFAQLTGTKTIPGDYASIALAITSLNSQGVGTGGVTFNITADYTETLTSPTAGYITTLTGSSTNPIVFQRSGSGGNPIITAGTGTSTTIDAIIAIAGCDYVTFDGINLSDNAANVTPTTEMEWGFAILKASATNGSQNITIKNCSVGLTKNYASTIGIYSNNHTTANTTQLTVTSAPGTNSNLKIFNNTVNSCYIGIYVKGYAAASPYTYYDQNNEIGKDGANSVINIGGATAAAYGIYTIYQNALKVANNSVTGTTGGTTNNVYGIYLTTANNASYDLYNNTVSMQFSPSDLFGNANFYAIYCDMGASGTTNTCNVYNNTVTNCTFSNSAAAAASRGIFLLNMGVTANVYGNVVSNNTIGGTPTATAIGEIRYMWFQKASTTSGPLTVHDNSVTGNTRVQSVQGGGATYFLAISGSGTTLTAYNNTIDNNTIAANGATQCLYITYTDGTSKSVYNNTITNILQANGSVSGLYNSNGKLGYFYNNKIQNITGSSTATGANINGIYSSSGTSMYFYNNFVSQLNCPSSIATLGYDFNMVNGIYVDAGTTTKGFYNNTIYLNATTTSSMFGSSAFCAATLTGVDLRNNIFVNVSASSGANGVTAGIRYRNNTAITNFSSNYNNIYAGTPGPTNFIYYYGPANNYYGSQTLADYKAFIAPYDLQSVTELPPFVNIATTPYNLHLQTNVATQCEKGGLAITTPFALTTDYDGDTRNATPDIGADEFAGTSTDIIPPAINYTPFTQTSSFLPRTLTATITDGSGVPTSGTGLPVLYWKLNNGSYQAVQGVWTSGSTYTFTFGAANAYHDQVSYYIVALDMAATPNVGAMPWQGAAGYTSNPPTCSTPPTTPSSYLVIQNITGIKHIGVGKDYTTLTAAAADLNDKFMSGAVTFVLDDATYLSETFPILFNPNPGNSVTNTLIIKPNTGATPTISGSSVTNGLIIFNGLDYVTLDGSNSGGTERSLAIENTSCSFDAHVVGISNNSGTDPSTNITLKNCVMTGANNISVVTTYVIRFNYNGGTTGGGYDNCLITNNLIQKAQFGIQVTASTGKINHNLVISNNLIGTANAANYITHTGIDLEQTDNASITGNEIIGAVTGTDLQSIEGIVYFNNCTNTKITKNKIHDWFSLGNGAMGIKCDNNNLSTVTEISNNLIYNIKCYGMNPGTGQNLAYGIMVRSGGNIRMVYNSIYLSGPYLDGSDNTGPSSACIGFMEWSTNQYDIRNNILRNSMTNPNPGAAGSLGKAYAIMINVPDPGTTGPAMFSSLDYNDYYIDGYRGQIAQRYGTGGTSMTDYPNLASWQAYIGQDAHTLTSNPLFASDVDPMDLHVSSPYMNCGGIFATGFPSTDYAGTTRKNPPDIGAYEFALTISDYHTLPATNVAYTTATINGDMNTNGEVVETYIVYGNDVTYGSYGNPTGWGATPKVRTFTLTALNAPITGLTPNTTYHYQLLCYPSTSSQASFTGADMTFTTLALQAPTMVSLAATAVLPTTATINGTALANGVSTTVSFEYGLTTSYGSTVTATPATVTGGVVTSVLVNLTGLQPNSLYHFRAKGVNSVGTGYGSDLTFTTPSSITFNVDMSTASGFVPVTDLVYMAGSFPTAPWVAPGDAGSLLMSRVGSTLTYTLTMNLPAGSYEYKYFKNAGWNGGEYAGGSNRSTTVVSNAVINDQWGGQINWANVQWPGTGTIDLGGGYDVYAQAFIGNGVTYAAGVAYGLQAWIGYSTSNTDPSTWTNWVAAPYFGQSGDNDEFKANLGAAITNSGTYYYASRFQFGNMAYIYGGFSGGYWDGTSNVSGVLTVNAPATKTLNAKVFLEGLYNAESGLLVKTQGADADGNVWDMFTGTIADTVSVAIAETTSPFNTVYEVHGAAINTDGSIVISTIPASVTGDHYIIIRHRNSIETWSQAVSFTAQTISFDMTDDVAKAWGSNLKQVGSVYCIYTGDANGDQYIDGFDLALVFNQNIAGAYNYQPEDLNGDGFVDGFDLALVFNNNLTGAGMNTPINPMGLIRAIRK